MNKNNRSANDSQNNDLVYVQDCIPGKNSKLYTLDLKSGRASLIGAITSEVYDLAVVGSQLYGLQQGKILS